MNKIILTAMVLGLAITVATPSQAQISLGSIHRHATRSVERAIERKIDSEIDKAAQSMVDKYWDRVLGKYYQDMYATEVDENGDPIYPFTMSSDVILDDEYSFDHLLKMQMDNYKKNGKLDETIFIYTHTNESENYLGTRIESEEGNGDEADFFIINDFDHEAMVMLTEEDGEKMRIAFSFKLDEKAVEKMAEDAQNSEEVLSTYKEIGTKEILGYSCKGYLKEDDKEISEVWISEEPIKGMEKAAAMLAKNKKVKLPAGYPEGPMLETTITDKKTKEKFIMHVVEINTKSNVSYKMSDYPDGMKPQISDEE